MLTIDKLMIREDTEFATDRVYVKGDAAFNALDFDDQLRQVYAALPQVLALLGIDGVATFDPHAGCQDCTCSPGFILRSRRGIAVWVDFVTK